MPRSVIEKIFPALDPGWIAVYILFFLYILSFVDRNILVLLSEYIAKDFGLSDFELSLLYGPAFAIVFALAGLPLGWAMDRFSRRVVIWACVCVWSLTTAACGLARDFPQLLLARAGVGAGEAGLTPGSQSILADMFPPHRSALPFSVFGLGGKMGAGLSFILGGFLIQLVPPSAVYDIFLFGERKGWQVIFLIVGLPGLLLALAIFLIPEPPRNRVLTVSDGQSAVSYREYLAYFSNNIRFFGNHHLAIILMMVVMTGIQTWTPSFLIRNFGWTAQDAGVWLGAALMVGSLIGIPIHGVLADRLFQGGRKDAHLVYMRYAVTLGTVPAAAAYFMPNPWISLVLIGISVGLIIAYIGLFPAALQYMVPGNMRGKAASIGLIAGGLGGMALGPVVVAVLTESVYGDPNMVGLSLATCMLIFLPLTCVALKFAEQPMRLAWDGAEHKNP